MKNLVFLGILLLLSSCATVEKVETAKTLEIHGPGVLQHPVIADLDVQQQKVRGTASGRSTELDLVKNMAMVNAIRTANVDVLIAPVYEIERKGRRTTVTVAGFPATYNNFRNATAADSTLVEMGHLYQANTAVVDDTSERKVNTGWVVAIAITVIGVLVTILAL